MTHCLYFQANIRKEETWFFVATLRSNEHLCFDRTLDTTTTLFEFFVPPANEAHFLRFIERHSVEGRVINLSRLPNRLAEPNAEL